MKQTLLEIVQRVSEFIDGETINSIDETREATQIANIVKETYEYLIQTREINTKDTIIHFDNLADEYMPNYLKYKDTVFEVFDLQYKDKKSGKYNRVQYLEPDEFLHKSLSLDTSRENVMAVRDFTDITYYIYKDRSPSYYTSFDDVHIVFDSYDSSSENTIHDENVIAQGRYMPEFKIENDFVPNMSPQHFPLLLSKSKEIAGMELKEYTNVLESNRAAKLTVITNRLGQRQPQEARIWRNRQPTGRR